jgi:hypothetical protein
MTVEESDTPPEKRLYCPVPRCSAFISPDGVTGSSASCPACQTEVCVRCRQVINPQTVHADSCARDLAMELQRDQGTKADRAGVTFACPNCCTLIAHKSRCAEVLCVCGTQVCARCKQVRRDCRCNRGELTEWNLRGDGGYEVEDVEGESDGEDGLL